MKKKIIIGALLLCLLIGAFFAWKFFGSSVRVHDKENTYLYIRTGASADDVRNELVTQKFLSGTGWFNLVSKLLRYNSVKPGRYKMEQGMSLVNLVRLLKNGNQEPVKFVITKIRTRENLAGRLGKAFEADSAQFISFFNSLDSLDEFALDSNTVMAAALPYSYSIKWNTVPRDIFRQFYKSYTTFWNEERKEKAAQHGLTPVTATTLASIVDEETRAPSDKPLIASVYLNRIRKGMPLQADPTIKFAMKNFELRRIYNTYLQTPSPYNTYMNKGLPPGPICTAQVETIDSVINSPETNYVYFVASAAFDGTHTFTSNYEDHMKYARLYQQELNKRNIK